MAKTSAVQKNLKRIKLVKKYAKKRAALKKIINNRKLELAERFEAQLKLNKLPKNSAKIRIRNRCEVSGRPHGVYRKLKISRSHPDFFFPAISFRPFFSGRVFPAVFFQPLFSGRFFPSVFCSQIQDVLTLRR